jgi:hypothetical protein
MSADKYVISYSGDGWWTVEVFVSETFSYGQKCKGFDKALEYLKMQHEMDA